VDILDEPLEATEISKDSDWLCCKFFVLPGGLELGREHFLGFSRLFLDGIIKHLVASTVDRDAFDLRQRKKGQHP
jgi:hypothetical protein